MNQKPLKYAITYLAHLEERFRRFYSEVRPPARQGHQYDIDNMILTDPERTLKYFEFEYTLAASYSLISAIVTIWFFAETKSDLRKPEYIFFYYWLLVGVILHPFNSLVKLLITLWLYRIPPSETLITRRLMLLIRSNLFYWNEKTSFVLYNYYALGLCKLACGNVCGNLRNSLYRFSHFLSCSLLLRLGNLFIRFFFEYYCHTRTVNFESIINHGATAEEIAAIPVEEFSEDQTAQATVQWCGICLEYFHPGDKVKKLPCSLKHYFHKHCTDAWLRTQNMCPYCRQSLRKPVAKAA